MTKGELVQRLKEFRFQDIDLVNSICLKVCNVMGITSGTALDKAERALQKNKGAFSEKKSGIKFDKGFLRSLNIETLLGLIFWLYGWEEVLMPWKYYEGAVKDIFDVLAVKTQKEDRKDAKIDGFRARRRARYNADSVTKYRERKLSRLDAKWITIGATPEDKEAGIPAGKGRHILIDDDGKVVSGAGGSLTGVVLPDAKSSSEEVKVDPSKVSTAAVGAGESKTGGAPTGEGGSASGAEPKPVEPKPPVEPPEPPKTEAKKLRVISSAEDFEEAIKGADAAGIKNIMSKLPSSSKVTLADGTYRKKTNGEWVLDGHKKPIDIDEIAGKDWSNAKIVSPVDTFKAAISENNAGKLRDALERYAVGTIIQFKKDGKWALERKNSGWVVTNSGGVWSGTNLGEKSGFTDPDIWKEFAETMDNWYVTRRKDTPLPTKPDDTLMDMFEKEAEKDDREFEDLLDRCEPGTEISLDGQKYTAIGKDGKNTVWAHDVKGDDYFEGDSWWLASEANKASNIYVGGKRLGAEKAYTEGRKVARADYEKYTTPEYLKSVCSLKHYDEKVDEYRTTAFKVFSDAEIEDCNNHLAKLFDNAEYCARFPTDVLDSIIENGFQNQFWTGTTHGYKDPGKGGRYHASHEMFGTEEKKGGKYVSGKEFEKYGFLMERDKIAEDKGASWYGRSCLVFDKDAVRDRITFTGGDSLGLWYEPGKAGNPPTVWGMLDRTNTYTESMKKEFIKKLKACKSITDLHEMKYTSYVEAQYHGDFPISTVKEIILPPGTKISSASQAKLDEYGIKVTFEEIYGDDY